MDKDIVVSAHGLTKAYRIWDRPSSRLLAPAQEKVAAAFPLASAPACYLRDRAARHYRDFYAVQDVSFDLKRGESLGIIGRNGSGKSTLLQILARTLEPTSGEFKVSGRVAALLELGSGFNPEFTGRENVMLNGAILGFSRQEMRDRFDQIADFAEIGDFIDQPVKTYSSGMFIRLAFAVAVSVKPDVLIVDEALSVGDIFFQQKCFEKIRTILSQGATLLFVSHSTTAVQNLCSRAILLQGGRVVFDGTPTEAATRYYALAPGGFSPSCQAKTTDVSSPDSGPSLAAFTEANNILSTARSRFGEKRLVVKSATIITPAGVNQLEAAVDDEIDIIYHLQANADVRQASFGVHLHDGMKECIFAAGARNLGVPLHDIRAGESIFARYRLRLSVGSGQYTLSIGCSAEGVSDPANPNIGVVDDRHEGIGPLTVRWDPGRLMPFYGKARLQTRVDYLSSDANVSNDLLRRQS